MGWLVLLGVRVGVRVGRWLAWFVGVVCIDCMGI